MLDARLEWERRERERQQSRNDDPDMTVCVGACVCACLCGCECVSPVCAFERVSRLSSLTAVLFQQQIGS